jgi:cytochrome c-type biogenesis protein
MSDLPGLLLLPFVGGVISFLSPCVLPLVPSYLSFVSGISAEELLGRRKRGQTKRIVLTLTLFILGFSIVFVLLGASASLVGAFLLEHKRLLSQVAGVLIILMGLFLIGLVRVPFLYAERRLPFFINSPDRPAGALGNIVIGMAFGFAWTPCIGPILSSILLYASTTATVGLGMGLLSIYAVGLGIPFMVSGLLLSRAMGTFGWVKRHYRWVNLFSGLLLIGMGVLLLSNQVFYVSLFFQRLFQSVGLDFLATI